MQQILATDPHIVFTNMLPLHAVQHGLQRRTHPAPAHAAEVSREWPWLDSHLNVVDAHTSGSESAMEARANAMSSLDLLSMSLSVASHLVTIFAKRPDQHIPMWDALVAPALGCSGLMVESWVHAAGRLGDMCGPASCVVDAAGAHFADRSWTIEQDHAKWALCCDDEIVCFGDLNRERAQALRGGLAVCVHSRDTNGLYAWLQQHARRAPSACKHCTC